MESLLRHLPLFVLLRLRKGLPVSVPEEIAFENGWIDSSKPIECAERYGKSTMLSTSQECAEGTFFLRKRGNMRILITSSHGQLGNELKRLLKLVSLKLGLFQSCLLLDVDYTAQNWTITSSDADKYMDFDSMIIMTFVLCGRSKCRWLRSELRWPLR